MSAPRDETLDLSGIGRRMDGREGRRFWQSLEELQETPEFLAFLHREFPENASEFQDPAGRRQFLKIMGASMALAGLAGCTQQPEEKIVPFVRAPEDMIPGRPLYFATALTQGGYANGVLVESHMGRPTKIEGNPEHPASLGATDAQGQADILNLYDPDRSRTLTYLGDIRVWDDFVSSLRGALDAQRGVGGSGLRILSETITSPTLAAQIDAIVKEFPAAKWHQWEPDGAHSARAGAVLAFGRPMDTRYDFARAKVVLTLDADFASTGAGRLRYIRDHSATRRLDGGRSTMSRLYAVECTPGLMGSQADHRLRLKPSEMEDFTRALHAAVGGAGNAGPWAAWLGPLVADLQANAGASIVMPGEYQPPAVHALAHAINERLGNGGNTVFQSTPAEARPIDQMASIRELAYDMERGAVSLLVVLGGNPVFTAPSDLEFARKMDAVPLRVHLGLYEDETAERCHWHVPQTHSLEAWGDARAYDGTITIQQPLIAPLYPGCKSPHEMLAAFSARPSVKGHDIVRDFWRAGGLLGADFERGWRRALHDGVVAGTASPAVAVSASSGAAEPVAGARPAPAGPGMEIVFRPDPTIGDGRFANNGWLQELPKPLTKLTWDNAAHMSPPTARRLGISMERTARGVQTDIVELRYRGRNVKAPAWIMPGHPDDTVTVHFGYGRRRTGRVGSSTGFDAYALRTSDAPWSGRGLEVVKTGTRYTLACTQDHWSMEHRDVVRAGTLAEYQAAPDYARKRSHEPARELTMYPNYRYEGRAWGMSIDLNACVGCNACVTACQAENNIPVVGKQQVAMSREMHWLRIDRYYAGGENDPEAYYQPMMCVHCENAPCEVVCPVAATVHSHEGLNDMVYNRCVGTRYCSNNCPYKVRRFNFFLYADFETTSLKLMRNPDVTVRSRGVMEKCTYCVQRINQAKMEATAERRALRDGDIVTACQAACPAQAIVFGDINDKDSRVAKLKAEPRAYGVLADLNTRPRTTYLAAVRNPNPAMPAHETGAPVDETASPGAAHS
jgi:MoCo/4Fe-4S cofactor protein with predicted Tat translocation signal